VEAKGLRRTPPQSSGGNLRLRLHIATRRTPLLRFARLSKTYPHALAPYWLSASASWFTIHLAVFARQASGHIDAPCLPQACGPLQSVAQVPCTVVRALTRFRTPTAQPSRQSHHSRALPTPGHVAPSR
jgi:hypothetical protein